MKKSILIIGAGPGLSSAVAEKFGKEDFSISLISRNAENLKKLKQDISSAGIEVSYSAANAGSTEELSRAIQELSSRTGGFDVVLYNAAVIKSGDIMQESSASLTSEFTTNVANGLHSLQETYLGLKAKGGAFLFTGGGFGQYPNADYGSLSIGKAGIRNLAYQLHDRLKPEGIYVGLLTVAGFIDTNSVSHSPSLLAGLFWKLYQNRSETEIQQ